MRNCLICKGWSGRRDSNSRRLPWQGGGQRQRSLINRRTAADPTTLALPLETLLYQCLLSQWRPNSTRLPCLYCIFISSVGRSWPDRPGLESYRAVDAHTRYRLHQWLRHKQNGKGAYPDEYLYEQLGLVRPARTTSNLPSAKASFVGQDTRELETFHSSLD